MHRKNLKKIAEEVIQFEINALKNLKKNINNSLVNLIKMIINCPNCSKKFQVPDNAIPKAGRTVQCSSCSHEWMQYPVKEQKVVKIKNPAPIKSSPPVNKARKIQKKAFRFK